MMNRPVELKVKTRPQLALESYLDALLQDATAQEFPEPILVLEPAVEPEAVLDEFQLAVLEEQARDAQVVVPITPIVVMVKIPRSMKDMDQAVNPPSATMSAPVIMAAWGPARKATRLAISVDSP